jgi:formate hydrogenlyase subunit 4
MKYVFWAIQILIVPAVAPLCFGIISKIKSRMQHKQGASILLPYKSLRKLFHKDEVISRDASWIFRVAPFIIFATTLIVGASVPLFTTALKIPTSDLLFVVYMMAAGTFFLALSGMDAGSAFGGFGSSREMTLSALAEGSLIFSILPFVVINDTTNLMAIAGNTGTLYGTHLVSIILAFIGFMIVLLAETKRYPFDNADTHLELTMVHEAMILEHSGKRLALMEWSAACKMFIFASLAANIFWPLGLGDLVNGQSLAIGVGALLAKVFAICIFIGILESAIAKFRYFRLPDLIFTSFVLNIIAIGLVL